MQCATFAEKYAHRAAQSHLLLVCSTSPYEAVMLLYTCQLGLAMCVTVCDACPQDLARVVHQQNHLCTDSDA